MRVSIIHASISERGTINGVAGDSTGKEVCKRLWYNKPWNIMLSPNDKEIGKEASEIARRLAESNLVGYSQATRNTLYTQLSLRDFNIDKYLKSKIKTNADCSSFIYAVYCCLIPKLRATGNAPTTSTMRNLFKKHDFTVHTESRFLTTDSYLQSGDILIKEGSHTVLVYSNGDKVVKKKDNIEIAHEVLAGLWGNGADRKNRLERAGYNYKDIQTIVNQITYR